LEPQPEPDVPKLVTVVEEEVARQSARSQPQLVVDAFYEGLHPSCRAGKLRVAFESYAAFRSDASVDAAALKWLKQHCENAFRRDSVDEDPLDWPAVKDLLVNLVVGEDCALGLSLLLSQVRHRDAAVAQVDDPPPFRPFSDKFLSPNLLGQKNIFRIIETNFSLEKIQYNNFNPM
jgi:hypothetical protein